MSRGIDVIIVAFSSFFNITAIAVITTHCTSLQNQTSMSRKESVCDLDDAWSGRPRR